MKTTVIGAGNVGALTAARLVEAGLCDVALLDIVEGLAKGKAEDIMDAAGVLKFNTQVSGSTDFSQMKDSGIVIITAGFARKPGMTREDLLLKNAAIVKGVTENIAKYAPGAVIINVTNPLDAMAYLAYKTSGFKKEKVIGMAGLLDSSRMDLAISRALNKPINKINSVVLGTHGETMAPALSQSKIDGKPAEKVLSEKDRTDVVDKTKNRGAEIVSYLKTGSAFFSPSAAAAKMAEMIIKDKKELITASCLLSGQYGISDIFLGVPAILGKNGIEKIVELKITQQEQASLLKAAESVKEAILCTT